MSELGGKRTFVTIPVELLSASLLRATKGALMLDLEGSTTPSVGPPPSEEQESSTVLTVASAWQRVKDHKVIQWGVAYFAAALALAHAYEIGAHTYHWPPIVGQILVGLLAIGFFVAIVLAWYHGYKGLTSFSRAEMSILAALMIVGAGMLYFFVQPAEHATQTAAHPEAGVRPVAVKPEGVSLAVLPFTNLSSDKEQEYFSDGMTEEITSALAKVPRLRVVGRTSAFQFKGANKDLRAIGRALGTNHLIEGSVQRAGSKVRITAQLIKADDGTSLWTEKYYRELKDVFAIQEEIATAITAALQVPLGLKEGETLVANRTGDAQSYQDYLRAKALVRGRGPPEPGGPLTQAAKLLETVVARDPNYAPAWGLLAQAYVLTPYATAANVNGLSHEMRKMARDASQKAEAAAQRAILLDPKNADAYSALGHVRKWRGRFVEAQDLFQKVLSVDPGDPEALHQYSINLAVAGQLKQSIRLRLRLRAQEPLVPMFNSVTAGIFAVGGRNEEAIAIYKADSENRGLARSYVLMGRYKEAAEVLETMPRGMLHPGIKEEAVRLLRMTPAKVVSPPTTLSRSLLGSVYLSVGAPDRALDNTESMADAVGITSSIIWAPDFAPVRKTERFKTLVRKVGLVDYWRARGWPGNCRPTSGDDFVCR